MSKMGSTYSICWYQGLSCLAHLGNNHSNRGRETPLNDGHRPTAPSFTLSGYHRTRRQVGTKNNKPVLLSPACTDVQVYLRERSSGCKTLHRNQKQPSTQQQP